MSTTATVNYHVHKPERQAFELDAGGIVGNLVAPQLVPTEITVLDERATNIDVTFALTSLEFAAFQTDVDVLDNHHVWRAGYEADLQCFLKTRLDVDEVIIFDHTVRIDNDESDRKPAHNVHSDYSKDGAEQRLVSLLGQERANEWAAGHYAFINVWRPVGAEINSSPLGFIEPGSVDEQDWILLDLIYPDRKGQILGLAANCAHQWVYRSKMTPEEVAFFNIYDNRGQPAIAHSALDMIEDPNIHTVRKSIESRTLVQYRDSS